MHNEQNDKHRNAYKKRKSRHRVLIVICLFLVMSVFFAVSAAWFIPLRIKQAIEQDISKFCEGPVEIDEIDINLSGYLFLKEIRFYDKAKDQWLYLDNVKATLTNLFSLNPVITEIEVTRLNLNALFSNGSLSLPLVLSSKKSLKPGKRLNIQKLNIKQAIINVIDNEGYKIHFDNLTLSAVRTKDHEYEYILNRVGSERSNTFFVKGKINRQDTNFSASLQMKHQFTKAKIKHPLNALKVLGVSKGSNLTADFTIEGNYKELKQLQSTGSILLENWIIRGQNQETKGKFDTEIKISSDGIYLENLIVKDPNNLKWLDIKTSQLTLGNWPGIKPVLTAINIDGLELVAYLVDSKLKIPFKFSSNKTAEIKNNYINLEKINVQNASVSIAQRPESKIVCEYLSMQSAENEDFYNIELMLSKPREPEPSIMFIRGFINPANWQASLSFDIDHDMTKQESAVFFAALGTPDVTSEGKLIADVTVNGHLNEPLGLQSIGKIEFDNWNVFVNDMILANELFTTAKLEGPNINFEEISANVYNGPVIGSVYIETEQNQVTEINGRFSGENISFTELTSLLSGRDKKAAKGLLSFNYNFGSKGNNLKSLNADGQILLNDADITVIPVIPYIFSALGLSKLDPVKLSDAECTFNMTGTLVKIKSAHIANPFAAIEIEPGGTIDLQTGQLDMYVITVPLRQLYDLVRKAPVADIIFNLREKLVRFYIRGHWSSPPAKLFTKTPIKDIKEGTIGFFQDVTRNGGNFGQEMIKGFKALLSIGQKEKNK